MTRSVTGLGAVRQSASRKALDFYVGRTNIRIAYIYHRLFSPTGALMNVPQQAFLRDAMRRLNMTRDTFASRIGVSRRALDTWLLPDDSQESRAMPEIVERFVSEIVVHGEPGDKYTQSVDSQSLASQMLFEGKPQLLSVDQFSRDSVT